MALTNDQKTRIEEEIKGILLSRIETFPDETTQIRNAPFHQKILTAFSDRLQPLNIDIPYLVAISSWLHGLNTSLGSGFENLAHIISGGLKKRFTGPYTPNVKASQARHIEEIIRTLKSGRQVPNLNSENNVIFDFGRNERVVKSLPFTVDNYVETENLIEGIELKSVRPNSGEGRGEKQKILYAKAAFKLSHSNKDVKFFIGFPFDPTSNEATTFDKERFFNYLIEFKKFFAPEEVLLGSELWDHLSGSTNTMEEILDVISNVVLKVVHNQN